LPAPASVPPWLAGTPCSTAHTWSAVPCGTAIKAVRSASSTQRAARAEKQTNRNRPGATRGFRAGSFAGTGTAGSRLGGVEPPPTCPVNIGVCEPKPALNSFSVSRSTQITCGTQQYMLQRYT
jgi:hypothetical protein